MKKKALNKDIILVLVTTLVTALVWVGLEVYRAYTKVEMPVGVERHLTPLDPQLDLTVLDELEKMSP